MLYVSCQAYEETHDYTDKVMNKADIECRRDLVEMLVDFCHKAGFQEEGVHDSVQLLDRLIFQNLGARNLNQVILFAAIAQILINQGNPTQQIAKHWSMSQRASLRGFLPEGRLFPYRSRM